MTEPPTWFVEPSFGQRVLARLVDGLILVPVFVLAALAMDPPLLVTVPVAAVYEIAFVARDGRTPGKRVLGLRIAAFDGGGAPSAAQAVVRYVVPSLPALLDVIPGPDLFSLLGVVIYLPILQGPLHRGLHDRAAGTVVTRG